MFDQFIITGKYYYKLCIISIYYVYFHVCYVPRIKRFFRGLNLPHGNDYLKRIANNWTYGLSLRAQRAFWLYRFTNNNETFKEESYTLIFSNLFLLSIYDMKITIHIKKHTNIALICNRLQNCHCRRNGETPWLSIKLNCVALQT